MVQTSNSSGVSFTAPTSAAGGAQASVDAASASIDALAADITSLHSAIAVIQEAIAILQEELAGLEPPDRSEFERTETRERGDPPVKVQERVFDSAAFNVAMSRHLAEVARLQSRIDSKRSELASKESQLANKDRQLAQAQADLARAQRELERALARDTEALEEARRRFEQQKKKAEEAQQQAVKAQLEAQKAQDQLQKANEELEKTFRAAAETTRESPAELERKVRSWDERDERDPPFACEQPDDDQRMNEMLRRMQAATDEAHEAMHSAADSLPRLRDNEILAPVARISQRDFRELAAKVESYELGLHAPDSGLLAIDSEPVEARLTPEMTLQMYDAWKAAGRSPEEIQVGLARAAGAEGTPMLIAALVSEGGAAARDLPAMARGLDPEVFEQVFEELGRDLAARAENARARAHLEEFFDGFSEQLRRDAAAGRELLEAIAGSEGFPGALDALAASDATGALRALAADTELLEAGGDALASMSFVRTTLDQAGIDLSAVAEPGKALASAVSLAVSIHDGEWGASVKNLAELSDSLGAEVVRGLWNEISSRAPEPVREVLDRLGRDGNVRAILGSLARSPNLAGMVDALAAGRADEALSLAASDPELVATVCDALVELPAVRSVLHDKLGLNARQIAEAGDALPHLLVLAGARSPDEAFDALRAAAEACPTIVAAAGERLWQLLPSPVRQGLESFGLDSDNLEELGDALPSLIAAAHDLGRGDWRAALGHLGHALTEAPHTVAAAVAAIGRRIPDEPELGLLRSVLTDEDLIALLASDQALHQGLKKILDGELTAGIAEVCDHDAVMTELGRVLLADPTVGEALGKLGITTPEELAEIGDAVGPAIALAEHLAHRRWGQAIESFGEMFDALPASMRATLCNQVAEALQLPPAVGELLANGIELLRDPEVRAHLGAAIEALKEGDAAGFVEELAQTGKTLASSHPDLAIAFLDLMGTLPGSVGRFFSSPELNEMIVTSGSLAGAFESMELLAQGKIAEALQTLAGAVGNLFDQPPHFEVNLGWGVRTELPFGESGLRAMAELFQQFVEALPERVKQRILTEVAELAAKAGGSLVPGGSLFGLVSDVPELVDSLNDEPKDWLEIALNGTQCALAVAGAFPGIGAISGPLGVVVGTIEVVYEGAELVNDVRSFANEFAFGEAA